MGSIPKVLLIEADDIAVMILKKSLRHAGFHHNMVIANDWQMATSFLCEPSLLDVIFLEPILPDVNVHEVLKWMHKEDIFNRANVYIVSVILPKLLTILCDDFAHKGCLAKPIKQSDVQSIIASIKNK